MKKSFLSVLLGAAVFFTAGQAHSQDKPVLNTAPPGTPVPTAPAPVATPVPTTPAPVTTPDRPSGLDLPSNRDAKVAGGGSSGISQKLFLYSGFGLGFSSSNNVSQFSFSISPSLGYRITDRLAAGPGISYSYNNYGLPAGYPGGDIKTNSVGVKAFAQFVVYQEFFIHGEYEVTRAQQLAIDPYGILTTSTKTVSSPLAGIGYRNQFSDRAAGDILVLYNFNETVFSIYPNPVIRFTFLFNLAR